MLAESTLAPQNHKDLIGAFENNRDTRFFFEAEGHREALSRLKYLVDDQNMGIGMLTGEIGCGKTISRTVLSTRLDLQRYLVITIENCLLEFDDLLLEIISQIHGERLMPKHFPDRYTRISEYKRLLVHKCAARGLHLVVILDEAQQLSDANLDGLKSLTNISSERSQYATLLLVGQPELRERVRALPQIDQRVSLRFHLNPLSAEECTRYLVHRLHVAGQTGEIPFTREACELIARESQGIPRNLNRLAKLAIDHHDANQSQVIDAQLIRSVAADLKHHGGATMSSLVMG